jgi:hypothetical protein
VVKEGKEGLSVGIVEGEAGGYYHGCGAIGSTKFRTYLRSPREYWFRYVSGEDDGEISECQSFGKIAHAVILEKEKYIYPSAPFDRRTKGGKEEYRTFVETSGGANVLEYGDGVTLERMLKHGLGNNPVARKLIDGCDRFETTYRIKHGDEYLQCRPDGLCDDYVVELKTCRRVDSFLSDFWRYGYHIQAAWYNYVIRECGYRPRDFEYIAMEKDGGYEYVVFEYTIEETAKVWENICEPALNAMMKSLKTETYDSSYKNVETIVTPDRYLDGERYFGR